MGMKFAVGSLVSARGREWVVQPPEDGEEDVLLLRPLGGADNAISALYLPLEGADVRPATFAPPDPALAGDFTASALLRDAVRLGFRNGAGPFRSLGHIAVEPRPYQIVPLLMALKQEPVRLLIADDVGIGKTIEAALIARELLDRGEIGRLCVLCPPHLCEQWQAELAGKFHIDAEVVRPGTVGRLERGLPLDRSVFDHYPFLVVSIDYIKSDRRRADFVRACAPFVIVDEAHTCAAGASGRGGQQQRHNLVEELARSPSRHLVLTTATPHSGVEAAFRSLLALLDPAFASLPQDLSREEDTTTRRRLAGHMVQRRRADIRAYLNTRTPFPNRLAAEATYRMQPAYSQLFHDVLAYASERVRAGESLTSFHRRVRWWATLALLRCVSSSPAAAALALRTRAAGGDGDGDVAALDALGERAVMDLETSDAAENDDSVPGADAAQETDLGDAERRRLRELAVRVEALAGAGDAKLLGAVKILDSLLRDGYRPVVFCRYIATAQYLGTELRERLKGVQVEVVTGLLPSEERAARVAALSSHERRLLVATDCLSEGINLQDGFDAVFHYDLSWNPTRHEQREGRVDRYGQPSPEVRAVLYYGENNSIDGAVLKVLLRKAESIRKSLGVSVPMPADSTRVLEAIFEALLSSTAPEQMAFEFDPRRRPELAGSLAEVDLAWEAVAEREKRSRTLFAQESLKPEEVRLELDEAAAALGDGRTVAAFVGRATERLGAALLPLQDHWRLNLDALPEAVRVRSGLAGSVRIGFELPVPNGVLYLARTHPLVEALGGYLGGVALDGTRVAVAARCGAIRTRAVETRTHLLLLRMRLHLDSAQAGATSSLLVEECLVAAFQGRPGAARWLDAPSAEALLTATPEANVAPQQRTAWLEDVLHDIDALESGLRALADRRAADVLAAHRRVRDAAALRGVRYSVRPQLPLDLLGVYVLMPANA